MIEQGQVFKLKTKGPDGQRLWAYRYRLEGRGSERPQVGGFATRAEAEKALRKVLDRLGPGGGRATITLAEFVNEYLEMHQAAPVTIAKLRWLLGKATAGLGEKRLADLSPRDVYAWRFSVPEGHRFEATQALRQVPNRAVAWGLLDYNPATRGVPNPARGRRRSGRSRGGGRSKPWLRSSGGWTGRWSSSPQRPGSGPRNGSDLSSATSTVEPASSTSAAPTRTAGSSTPRPGRARGRCRSRRRRSKRSTGSQRRTTRSCFRTRAAAGTPSGSSDASTGGGHRSRPVSSRSAASTTCATPTPPSRSGPEYPCSPSRASWARASR